MARQKGTSEAEFASAPLVALVLHSLAKRAPELVPEDAQTVDSIRRADVSLELKKELLERAYTERGGRFVFEIGESLSAFGAHPLVQSFLRSQDGDVLLQKWIRLERYGHSRHRTNVVSQARGVWRFEHYAHVGPPPGPAHDLFVLGALVAMLRELGVAALNVSLPLHGAELVVNGENTGEDASFSAVPANQWLLQWRPDSDLDTQESTHSATDTVASQLNGLFLGDAARGWNVSDAARSLGLSARSLQRRLREESTSFSEVVRAVRVSEACRLLETSMHSATEIGYLCGFSDAAHFSRDFRASVGASPSDFRNAVGSRDESV